ncbi:MAG: prepilin peptidase [Isosphaeraceae bacterium]
MPLLSWLALRDQCQLCRAAIPSRECVSELAGGFIGGMMALVIGWRLFSEID